MEKDETEKLKAEMVEMRYRHQEEIEKLDDQIASLQAWTFRNNGDSKQTKDFLALESSLMKRIDSPTTSDHEREYMSKSLETGHLKAPKPCTQIKV